MFSFHQCVCSSRVFGSNWPKELTTPIITMRLSGLKCVWHDSSPGLQSCSTNLATPGTFWAVLTSRSCLRTSLVTPGSCSAFYAASITAPGALGTRQAGCPWRRPPLPSITRACGQCCCVVLQQAKPNFLDRLKVQGVFPTRIGSAESKEKKPKIPHVELF